MNIEIVMSRLHSVAYTTEGVVLQFSEGHVVSTELARYFSANVACEVTQTQRRALVSPKNQDSIHSFWNVIRDLIDRAGGQPVAQTEQLFDVLDEIPPE